MPELDVFLSAVNIPEIKERYALFNSLKKEDYPDMNYIGINFKGDDITSIKIYFSFFHKIDEKDVLKFIPISEDYNKYIHLWQESKTRSLEHSGCAFTVKIKPGKPITYGFHYRLKPSKETYDLIGRPSLIPFNVDELDTRPGINFEYCNNETLVKRYYYFHTTEHLEYFAKRYNNSFVKDLQLLEYTESEFFSKAIFWLMEYSEQNFNRPNLFSEKANKVIKGLNQRYGLINIIDGYYENDNTIATYFFNTVNNNCRYPFDVKENFQIDTVKLFI